MEKNKVTIIDIQKMKSDGKKIAVLTAYDYPFARLIDEAGVDIILVIQSLLKTKYLHICQKDFQRLGEFLFKQKVKLLQ